MNPDARNLDLLERQLTQVHRNAVAAELATRNLSKIGHPMLLTILETSEGAPERKTCQAQRDLAELLHISPPSVSSSRRSLEQGGYITRTQDAADARRYHVCLTRKGKEAVQGCREAFDSVASRMLDGFSQEELQQLIEFRRRMLQNLQD